MSRPTREQRSSYPFYVPITTRWMDNDVYGHVNNVAYYSYFDTAANRYLIDAGLDIHTSETIAVVIESGCRYHEPIAYPEPVEAGVRVEELRNRAVRWGIAIFRSGQDEAVAAGTFVHVFVDRTTRQAVSIPAPIRAALEKLR